MTNISDAAEKFNNDLMLVRKELKRLSSAKCRAKDEVKRNAIRQEEAEVKAVLQYLTQRKSTKDLTEAEISRLSLVDTNKAISNIRSLKSRAKWSVDSKQDETGLLIPGTSADYIKAIKVEKMLLKRRQELMKSDTASTLIQLLNELKQQPNLSAQDVIQIIENALAK